MDAKRLVGANLKRLREAQGWSQEELADHAGIHRTYVSGVERGIRNPTVTVLLKLAQGLEAPLTELVKPLDDHRPNPPARRPRGKAG